MKGAAIRKLNINGVTSLPKGQLPQLEESYKQISEDQDLKSQEENSQQFTDNGNSNRKLPTKEVKSEQSDNFTNTVVTGTIGGEMVAEQPTLNDGADEHMLNGAEDIDKLTDKHGEVKFFKGDDHQNGDAKIDIGGVNGKAFTGMSKEELMKYANDPFWVRLRWIFFIAFWAIWVAMLVCAIFIIIEAPKCAAPEPLKWYKRGLLAKFNELKVSGGDVDIAERVKASGVIYELSPAHTYLVQEPAVEQKIKELVDNYKKGGINVILDITPNYVGRDSTMLNDCLKEKSKRSAFVWKEDSKEPNNWRSLENGSAWEEILPGNYLLSQFGVGLYDLRMNDSIVKHNFENVLKHLLSLGVKGFRLRNTKFFLFNDNTPDEVPASEGNFVHNEYGFWTHTHSTFQEGLGDLLYEYKMFVKNISDEAFLSVADDVLRPDVYRTKNGEWGIDMPIYGQFLHTLRTNAGVLRIQHEFVNTLNSVGNDTWLQWNFAAMPTNATHNNNSDPTAIALFVSLLPGVPIVSIGNSSIFKDMREEVFAEIKQLRLSASYMHGEYQLYPSEKLFAYSRIKSGNPGYFVAYNPSENTMKGDFVHPSLPDKMSVYAISDNYNSTNIVVKSKVETKSLEVSPKATIILTYVPVKSD